MPHIYKHGFPANTPHHDAIAAAKEGARRFIGDGERVLAAEVMEQSPEHAEAGEFLVRVEIGPASSGS